MEKEMDVEAKMEQGTSPKPAGDGDGARDGAGDGEGEGARDGVGDGAEGRRGDGAEDGEGAGDGLLRGSIVHRF